MAEKYLFRALEVIKADYSVERSDFLDTRLALLDEIIEANVRCKQHSNAVGALRLQAEITRLLDKYLRPQLRLGCVTRGINGSMKYSNYTFRGKQSGL